MIARTIKEMLYGWKQLLHIAIYNHMHDTRIYSLRASLKANYAKGVSIGKGTSVMPNVSFGEMSYVNENSWIENCVIGRWCSISDHVSICPAEHNIHRILSHPILGNPPTRKVTIGDDVLISHNVTILEGVNVGNGAVIGAGAVVTSDVLPYSVVGGTPAHFIKWRFDEEIISRLSSIDLYSKDIEKILEIENKILKDFGGRD